MPTSKPPTEDKPAATDKAGAPTNKALWQRGYDALKARVGWEEKLARAQLQRFCQDRARVNNVPWPRASNVRYPLSDMVIDQKKPMLFRSLFTSEHIPAFKSLVPDLWKWTGGCAAYYDFILKERTNFEDEVQFSADGALQDGETVIKTTWDDEAQVPRFEAVDNLFIITPQSATVLERSPWVIHVQQWHREEFVANFKRYRDEADLEAFCDSLGDENSENDQSDREEDEYQREGIDRTASGKEAKIVTWEIHYLDGKGGRRLRTVSPDDTDFDFKDDRAYPYEWVTQKGNGGWMFVHYRREKTKKPMHSSRGLPELLAEGEHSLSAMWRSKHNAMTMFNAPVFEAANGIPGSAHNISLIPGSIMPFPVKRVDMGSPPISWDEEMMNTRSVWERRAATPDFGIGRGNQGAKRTATEVQAIGGLMSLDVEMETANWRKFIRQVLRQGWALIVQYRPKSLAYIAGDATEQLPMEALRNDYLITVAGSADALNKEAQVAKAMALWQTAQGNPFARADEAYRNVIETMFPGQVQRFFADPGRNEADAVEKAAQDIGLMLIGFPVQVRPGDNHVVAAMVAIQFLEAKGRKGEEIDSQAAGLIGRYIAGHREALKQSKDGGEAYRAVTQELSVLNDAAARVGGKSVAALPVPGALPEGAPAPSPVAAPRQPVLT